VTDSARRALPLLIADLFEAAGAARRSGEAIAATEGQTQARWQLLSVISEGDWTVAHAARRLGITRQAVQRTTDELLAAGMAVAEANPNHQRSPLIRPTADGRAALARISERAERWHAELAEGLDAEDVETARRVLQALSRRQP
jgi:DNA-binding MarR family transcriptional regulator